MKKLIFCVTVSAFALICSARAGDDKAPAPKPATATEQTQAATTPAPAATTKTATAPATCCGDCCDAPVKTLASPKMAAIAAK